jgi:hypothetical protein
MFEIGGMLGMFSINDEVDNHGYLGDARFQKRMAQLFLLSYGKLSVVVTSTDGDLFVLVQFGDD